MKIETLRDVLHWSQQLHAQLNTCLRHCEGTTKEERVRLLLSYLSEHEARLSRALATFEEEANTNALNTWCAEYIEKQPIERHKSCNMPLADLPIEEIILEVVHHHEQIVILYQHLEAYLPNGHAKQLLTDLIDLENHEAMQAVKHYQQLKDL
jgi:hypothetical protein